MEKNTGASSNSPQQQPNPERKVKRGVRRLRRTENCVQWGFRVEGGADCKEPLHIIKVTPRSLAEKSGLQAGDVIIKIGKVVTKDLTHDSAKMEILRAGNELDLVLERDFSKVKSKPVTVERKPVPAPAETPEESNRAYTNPNVQSRSFLILQENLERGRVGQSKRTSDPSAEQP